MLLNRLITVMDSHHLIYEDLDNSLSTEWPTQKIFYFSLGGKHHQSKVVFHSYPFKSQVIRATFSCNLCNECCIASCNCLFPVLPPMHATHFHVAVMHGKHSIRFLGPRLWSKIPSKDKLAASLKQFKTRIHSLDLSNILDGCSSCYLCNP